MLSKFHLRNVKVALKYQLTDVKLKLLNTAIKVAIQVDHHHKYLNLLQQLEESESKVKSFDLG